MNMEDILSDLRGGETELHLNFANIGNDGAQALGEELRTNETLHTLDLYLNDIGDDGAAAIAAALRDNRCLTLLNLAVNDIGDEGASALAAGLRDNRTLTELHLADNSIGNTGAKELASMLARNRALTSLQLEFNDVQDEGARALAAALRDSHTLVELRLADNDVNETLLAEIEALCGSGASEAAAEAAEVSELEAMFRSSRMSSERRHGWVRTLLEGLYLGSEQGQKMATAVAWCNAQGIDSAATLKKAGAEADLAGALQLRLNQEKLLLKRIAEMR